MAHSLQVKVMEFEKLKANCIEHSKNPCIHASFQEGIY